MCDMVVSETRKVRAPDSIPRNTPLSFVRSSSAGNTDDGALKRITQSHVPDGWYMYQVIMMDCVRCVSVHTRARV
jgi:hypothetical protein